MLDFDIDKCLKVVKNKYDLILLAKARAHEIFGGSQTMVEKSVNEKSFFSALKEISGMHFSYDYLDEKAKKMIKNEIFGIYTEQINASVDKFDDSSIFAKSFLSGENSDGGEKIELEDLLGESNKNSEKYMDDSSAIKMIGSFENFDEENLSEFTDGLEIFENEDFKRNNEEND